MNSKAERLPFSTFWTRLQNELESLQETKGYHCGKAKKWSHDKDYFGEEFKFLFKGGSVIYCQTGTTDKLRSVSRVEFEKVYAVWEKYCSGEGSQVTYNPRPWCAKFVLDYSTPKEV